MPPPLHARALAVVLFGLVACDVPALVELAPDAARDAAADVAPAPSATPSCPDPAEHGCARVRVTGGAFTQGADDLPEASPPLRDLRVSDFTLDGYEVTVARARRFRDDLPRWLASLPARDALEVRYPNGATLRVSLVGLAGATLQNPAEGVGINRLDDPRPAIVRHPFNGVSWDVAQAFCAWDGGRLPTEAEWEYAARWWRSGAPSGRTFPWGDAPPVGRCDLAHWMIAVFTPNGRCAGTDGRASRPVGSLSLGQTSGLFDLAGNTLEWVADRYVAYGEACAGRTGLDPLCDQGDAPERALRGGSAQTPAATPARLRTAARARQTPERQDNAHGFRCAR